VTWAPFKNGKTTVRGSWGIFYDWLPIGTYEQTLRVDGFRQQELQVVNPTYPALASSGTVSAVNRYLLDPNLRNPTTSRFSGGVDYLFTPQFRLNASVRLISGKQVMRGENLNAPDPVTGLRPDPTFGNVVEVVSDAQMRQRVMTVSGQYSPKPLGSGPQPLWKWNRISVFGDYTVGQFRNNSDGPFSPPFSGSLASEWGPSSGSSVQRASGGFSFNGLRNLNTQFYLSASSGTPYTITTGRDDNGDLIFNDRPAGVGRNTARTPGQWSVNGYISYQFTFGPRLNNLPPGIMINGGPGGYTVSTMAPPSVGRYRISFNCNVQNLTNHTNLSGYSGNMLSPFFGKPTNAFGQRRIDVGMNLGF
jgi:hypothetical protein